MNLPNKLTLLRVILAPVFVAFALWDTLPCHWLIAAGVFAVAAITDAADGAIARRYALVTTFGKFLDPVADKLVTTAAFLLFVHWGWCSPWVLVLVLLREYCMICLRLTAARAGTVLPANLWGKIKTVLQMVSILVLLVLAELQGILRLPGWLFPTLCAVLLWGTAVAAAISGLTYFGALWRKGTADTLRPKISLDLSQVPVLDGNMKLRDWLPSVAASLQVEVPQMLRHLRALALEEIACAGLTAMAVLYFLAHGWLNPWPALVLFSLEFAVASFRLIAAAQNKEPPANSWTVARICALGVTIALYLTALFGYAHLASAQITLVANLLFGALCIAYMVFGLLTVKFGKKITMDY
ncbi:MAG: CDP-diacylglycerol--glycerol-3-phosphate 3-phosphatidyltransferase [Oscillospiraceae bacterium]|jgi:CDP-diacylglycerol--glycerol-3-phosphate 3-phosphatidyltransferase|nr:CDP-diacylglycerol--glycerol-3-phosphate 3-phosphatidyltransferase [Oscillospiraceae bacterium]